MLKFVIISSLALPSSIQAFMWTWTSGSASCAGDPFRNVALSIICARGHYTRQDPTQCEVGDTAYAKGSLLATMPFSNGQVIVTPSVAGVDIIWDKRTYGHLSDWLHPLGDHRLGEAGFYTISYAMPLPTEEGSWPGESWILNNFVTGHITVKNNGECNTKYDEEVDDGWYPLYSYAMLGLITCLAIARGLFVKRRKCNCDNDVDVSSPATYFEMAGQHSQEEVV